MCRVDHRADTIAAQQFDALANQIGVAFDNHPLHITIRPDAAMVSSAFRRIPRTQAFIGGGPVSILFLLCLVLLQLVLVLLLLALILLPLCLILGVVGIGLGIGRSVAGRDLFVDRGRLGLFFRRGMGCGHAVGINPVAAGRGITALGKGRRYDQ